MKTAITKELSAGPQAEHRVGAAGQGWWQALISPPPIALILHRAWHLCLSQVLLCVAAIASSKL